MNILELCLSPGLGGLELYVFRASSALCDNHNVTAALHENSKLDNYYKEHSTIKRIHLKRSKSPIPVINARKLANVIDNNNIDIIHMHWGKDFSLAAFAKAFSKRKPALVYTRQMMITRAKNDFYHNFLYGQMDLMLTITRELETLAKNFIHRYAQKITTLYYGVKQPTEFLSESAIKQQRESLGFSEHDFIAGLIGRLEESKGQRLLIEAVHQAKIDGHNIKALIVGHEMDKGYREKLQQQAANLDIADRVIFQDFVSDPQQLMQLCDSIVLASGRETFGLVLPEAMRAGIAVIGSNGGGVPEIIEHEQTGLLFESGNASNLYEQLKRLYLEPDFKNKLALQGKQSADDRFNNTSHFKKLEQHLEALATSHT